MAGSQVFSGTVEDGNSTLRTDLATLNGLFQPRQVVVSAKGQSVSWINEGEECVRSFRSQPVRAAIPPRCRWC